jgi:hypothetical protein
MPFHGLPIGSTAGQTSGAGVSEKARDESGHCVMQEISASYRVITA